MATVTGGGEPERVSAPLASVGFFETFEVNPAVGRFFAPDEGQPGGAAVVVLSHGYWQRRYAGDPGIVGAAISVEGLPTTVVGVAPAGFRFLMDADMWRPIQRGAGWASARQFHNFVLVGRLADGTSVEAAQAEIDAISTRLEDVYPDTNRDKGLNVTPLRQALAERYGPTLNILSVAVAVLLLIACANVSGLLLARGGARRSEMAVRSVMGGGRGRLARQLLTENVYLALGAGVVGTAMAVWIQRGILTFMSMEMLGRIEPGISGKTLVFALSMSALTVLLFGVIPSLSMTRTDPAGDLRAGAGRGGERRSRFRSGLVVAQVAMTAVLLAVSGLLFRSFQELTRVESGFDTEQLLTAEVSIPRGKYGDAEAGVRFFEQLTEQVRAIPGASSVAVTTHLPIQDPGGNIRVSRPEEFGADGVFGTLAYRRSVMPGYFDALAIPLVGGRDVQPTDNADAPEAVILSAALAARLFGNEDPMGRTVAVDQGGSEPGIREVIGVVGDVVSGSLSEGRDLTMYYPYGQSPSRRMRLAVRARGDLGGVVTGVREALRTLDPDVPLSDVTTMDEAISQSVSDERTVAVVLVLFAGVALLLAGVGLYGTLAYQVSRRLHEIGVRIALGASRSSVTRGIVGDGLRLVAFGLVLGIPGAYAAGRLVQGMLFGVEPADPLTLLGVAGFLSVVAVTACLLPARRAARVDPVEAFRSE
jgi:putative ABC transport system permease protein